MLVVGMQAVVGVVLGVMLWTGVLVKIPDIGH